LYLGNNSYVSFQPGGTEKFKITSDGRGLSQFTAKVWVNFNGTGTIAIRDSHNVSSLTDNSTGYYTINFSNNLANANFCEVVGADQYHSTVDNGTQTTGLFKIGCFNSANGWADAVQVRGLVFGD
jgi:hypothetical protein